MKKKKPLRSPFEKLVLLLSAMLIGASGFMFFNIDRNKVDLQSPKSDFFAQVEAEEAQKKAQKNNPFVIRDGSNAMPKGMGQFDAQEQEFTPKWQSDRIKDMKDRGIDITAEPAPSMSNGGGIAPAAVQRKTTEPVVEDEDENDLVPGSHSVP